jgi:hypothetical protein
MPETRITAYKIKRPHSKAFETSVCSVATLFRRVMLTPDNLLRHSLLRGRIVG